MIAASVQAAFCQDATRTPVGTQDQRSGFPTYARDFQRAWLRFDGLKKMSYCVRVIDSMIDPHDPNRRDGRHPRPVSRAKPAGSVRGRSSAAFVAYKHGAFTGNCLPTPGVLTQAIASAMSAGLIIVATDPSAEMVQSLPRPSRAWPESPGRTAEPTALPFPDSTLRCRDLPFWRRYHAGQRAGVHRGSARHETGRPICFQRSGP